MSGSLKAHIFGRRRRGDREEVSMKLFNPDGSSFSGASLIRTGMGNPNRIFVGEEVAHDDFSTNHLSDPEWWERTTPDPDVSVENDEVLPGGTWGGLLSPGGELTPMRTTVVFKSLALIDQVAALVRGKWSGSGYNDNNFSYIGAWITNEDGPMRLSISSHSPSTGYNTILGPEVTLSASRFYWLRCSIDEENLVTAELFGENPDSSSIPIETHTSDWSNESPE